MDEGSNFSAARVKRLFTESGDGNFVCSIRSQEAQGDGYERECKADEEKMISGKSDGDEENALCALDDGEAGNKKP